MKTDVIKVSPQGSGIGTAVKQVDFITDYKGLDHKSSLHLRLLTEEMMGMVRSITGADSGDFWIEDEDGVYQLHLRVETVLTSAKREMLLAASTSGKNESARGLMGAIRDFFDRSADADVAQFTNPLMLSGIYDQATTPTLEWEWSMTRCQDELYSKVQHNDAGAIAAWDELEKSVVAHVADDVKVSIRGPKVEVIIIKKLG